MLIWLIVLTAVVGVLAARHIALRRGLRKEREARASSLSAMLDRFYRLDGRVLDRFPSILHATCVVCGQVVHVGVDGELLGWIVLSADDKGRQAADPGNAVHNRCRNKTSYNRRATKRGK